LSHCLAAENRTPAVGTAYPIARGVDWQAAIKRAASALGSTPQPFLVTARRRLTRSYAGSGWSPRRSQCHSDEAGASPG
jgi:hypothetical protein